MTRIIFVLLPKKKMKKYCLFPVVLIFGMITSCERVISPLPSRGGDPAPLVSVEDMALVLSQVGLDSECLSEVYDAVCGSVENGYDSEYTMRNVFDSPGGAVGMEYINDEVKACMKQSRSYTRPLRDVIAEYFASSTKASGSGAEPSEYTEYLRGSDYQIYWPYFENWDGHTMPVVACEPADGRGRVLGYLMDADGALQEFEVTEEMAMQRPVWVINHNDDSGYVSLDVYRKNHPEIGEGGNISIGPSAANVPVKTLIMQDFTMKRNYDPWYKGGSEFMVRIGSLEYFTASTEAEMKLFNPYVTEMMIECRRSEVGDKKPLNSILVSGWTSQLDRVAFMITEDDGGTRTKWDCSAVVKINSKSYGFEISLPFNSYDDIVWRGQLSGRFFETAETVSGTFGEVAITFKII